MIRAAAGALKGSVVYATAGTYSFTVPEGVTQITVKLWGGGGAGSGIPGNYGVGAGGAGGQFAQKTLTVEPGSQHTVVVAASKTGTTSYGATGNDSSFAATAVVAKGGAAPSSVTSPGLGSTTGGVGDIVYKGGDGGVGASGNFYSGPGGGGAGSSGAGGNGSTATGVGGAGAASYGGNGGAGRYIRQAGLPGSAAGGGGGGAFSPQNLSTYAGGAGAAGRAEISW